MKINQIQLETLKKGLKVSCVKEEYVLRIARVSQLEEFEVEKYLSCLAWLMEVARGTKEAPQESLNNFKPAGENNE